MEVTVCPLARAHALGRGLVDPDHQMQKRAKAGLPGPGPECKGDGVTGDPATRAQLGAVSPCPTTG